MKTATFSQTKDVAIRILNLKLDGINGDAIQKGLEGFSIDDIDRRLVAFLNNGLNFVIKGPSALIINRTKPFDTSNFLPIWRGPKDGNGLNGEEEQDHRSLTLTEIDFAKVFFTVCLKDGEPLVTGEEKLVRHVAAGHIRLDAKIGQCLLEEKDQTTLEWLYRTFGITWFELPGTVLRLSGGGRYFLCLCRGAYGPWYWYFYWLGFGRDARSPSAVLASST